MKRITLLLATAWLLVAQTHAQSIPETLKLGSKFRKEISGKDIHQYQVNLQKDQYFFMTITDPESDFVVRVMDPEGNLLQELDDNGIAGEFIHIFSEMEGAYGIMVKPFRSDAANQGYDLEVRKLEALAESKEGQLKQFLNFWDQVTVPGIAVAIIKNDQCIFQSEYGLANLEYGIPLSADAVFDLASVSKLFTGMAIEMLVDKGQLSLQDEVRSYLPEVPDFGQPILIQHLLNHSSGLRDIAPLLDLSTYRPGITMKDVLDLVKHQRELNFKPGSQVSYSNTGFVLLAAIVEKVTGVSFREWTRQNIFTPLGMNQTFFNDQPTTIIADRVCAYNGYPDNLTFQQNNGMSLVGSSGLYSTTNDLVKWMLQMNDTKMGKRSIIELMQRVGGSTYQGLKMIEHTGSTPAGFRTAVSYFPEQQFGVIVLSNWGAVAPVQMICKQVSDFYLSEYYHHPASGQEIASSAPDNDINAIPTNILERYVGKYNFKDERIITITRRNGLLVASADGRDIELEARGNNTFFVPPLNSTMKFIPGEDGLAEKAIIREEGRLIAEMPRVKERNVPIQQLPPDALQGDYYSEELRINFHIDPDPTGKLLVLSHPKHGQITLKHQQNGIYKTQPQLFSKFQFIIDDQSKVQGFIASMGKQAQNMKFKKWR